MSNFPTNFDDDVSLPFVNNNLTELGAEAINALRDAVIAMQQNMGLGAAGTTLSLATRLGISILPNGQINPSAITGLGLVTLPITDTQISNTAQIKESKLSLDHGTQDLFNYITNLSNDVRAAQGWVAITGVKLNPHLSGSIYRHTLSHIDVSNNSNTEPYLNNVFGNPRDNLNSYQVLSDINFELLNHQFADGSIINGYADIVTNNNTTYPSIYAHPASGIFLSTGRFSYIPHAATDLQKLVDFIDTSSVFLLGTRIQNLYSNGISRASRSAWLGNGKDGYGNLVETIGYNVVPSTPVITYLQNLGNSSKPEDNIDTGDDIIEFKPTSADLTNNSFSAKFALVKVGDIIRVNYGNVESSFIIKEKKYILTSQRYVIRIAGKNLAYKDGTISKARIDRPLFNNNKYGILAVAPVNNSFSKIPSLIVASPRGGEALGIGFSPDQFDEKHYLLSLILYPTGNPKDGYVIMPPIDVTGNTGTTPGAYTLESIVESTNTAFRLPGFNYRFIAFSYKGEFGIMLADAYNNAAFSIVNGIVDEDGFFDPAATGILFSNNVVGLAGDKDPLGFGFNGSDVASPPYSATFLSVEAAQNPTKLFVPLVRSNFYINGIEKSNLNIDAEQVVDGYGDGYWFAKVKYKDESLSGRLKIIYSIEGNLSTSGLKIGKTLVAQSLGVGTINDFGRFIIQEVNFNCGLDGHTEITVYDAVHGTGYSPAPTLPEQSNVAIYFGSDSVSFNTETATDYEEVSSFKRHFEIYMDEQGNSFTHERGRILLVPLINPLNEGVDLYFSNNISKIDIIRISPKLRGYQFGSVNKITLHINNYDSDTGLYDGFLALYNGTAFTRRGPVTNGKKGQVIRFYDETNIDYIDIIFDFNAVVGDFSNENIDFQLFPTLSLDDEIMLIGTCQLNNTVVSKIRDERQFGNISEKELSTSALNFMALPERILHFNGVVKGFDIVEVSNEFISLKGGVTLVNGKFQNINNEVFAIPKIQENISTTLYPINWILCINSVGEYEIVPMSDYDSVLGTPNVPNRLFSVINLISGNTYTIDCSSFSDILNNKKYLTPLYIVASTIVGTGPSAIVSLNIIDIRRYVNDQDSSIPAVVTDGNSQGNFKNFISAVSWIKLNNKYQNTIQIKGAASTNTNPKLIDTRINIIGQGIGSSLSFTSSNVMTMTNTTFDNLTVVFNKVVFEKVVFNNCNVTFSDTTEFTNVIFNNCTALPFEEAADFTKVIFNNCNIGSFKETVDFTEVNFNDCNVASFKEDVVFTDKVSFKNCSNEIIFEKKLDATNCYFENSEITVTDVCTMSDSFMTRSQATFTSTIASTNNKFIHCTLDFASGGTFVDTFIDPSKINIGGTITIGATNKRTSIIDSEINITITKAFLLASGFRLENNRVSYEVSGAPGGSYSGTDLVNITSGLMHNTISTSLKNVEVKGNTFTSSMAEHFPFFSIQMSSYQSVLENINLSKNSFISTASSNDTRAVISIVSMLTDLAVSANQPRLVNVFIEDNKCNHDQIILISATRSANMVKSLLIPINTRINNNICGTIGFITGSNKVSDFTNYATGEIRDKEDQLVISGNTCKLITNLDATGDYIPFRPTAYTGNGVAPSTSYVQVATGSFYVENNKTNWIQLGSSSGTELSTGTNPLGSGGFIINNRLSPSNPVYLDKYLDATSGVSPDNVGILLRRENAGVGTTHTIISGNILTQKPLAGGTISTAIDTKYYYKAAIVCFNNAAIKNNSVTGVINTTTDANCTMLYISNSPTVIATGNYFNRIGQSIGAYVTGVEGATNNVTITNNIFDTYYVDGTSYTEGTSNENVGKNISNRWAFNTNTNQTFYIEIALTDDTFGGDALTDQGLLSATYPSPPFSNFIQGTSINFSVGALEILDPISFSTFLPHNHYVEVRDTDVYSASIRRWSKRFTIDTVLPPNTQIINAKIGYFEYTSTNSNVLDISNVANPRNGSTLTIWKHNNTNTSNSSTGILDVKNNLNPATFPIQDLSEVERVFTSHVIDSAAKETALRTNTEIITVDLSNKNFVTGNSYRIGASFEQSYKKSGTNSVWFYWSPVVLKCVYRG